MNEKELEPKDIEHNEDELEQDEEEEKKRKKWMIILLIILLLLFTFFVSGVSFNYITKVNDGSSDITSENELSIYYLTSKDINVTNQRPIEQEEAPVHAFMLENNGTKAGVFDVSLSEINLTKDGKRVPAKNMKWKLFQADGDKYNVQKTIASGDFNTIEDTIQVKSGISIDVDEKQYYILKIWLEEIGVQQNEDQGLSLSTKVKITISSSNK